MFKYTSYGQLVSCGLVKIYWQPRVIKSIISRKRHYYAEITNPRGWYDPFYFINQHLLYVGYQTEFLAMLHKMSISRASNMAAQRRLLEQTTRLMNRVWTRASIGNMSPLISLLSISLCQDGSKYGHRPGRGRSREVPVCRRRCWSLTIVELWQLHLWATVGCKKLCANISPEMCF